MNDKPSTNNTVVILGAGASFASAFKLPLMEGFFGEDLTAFPRLSGFLNRFYGGRKASSFNLEEVLGYLDLSRNRIILWEPRRQLAKGVRYDEAYAECIAYLKHRLSLPPQADPCALHTKLLSSLDRGDTIVSLNYDLIADRALSAVESLSAPPSRGFRLKKLGDLLQPRASYNNRSSPALTTEEVGSGFFLKLHGSLDWLSCPSPDCPNHQTVFPLRYWEALGINEGALCRACGVPLEVVLLPPVSAKRFDERGKLSLLWKIAYEELTVARRWVLIGLSLPASDFELRWLLKQAIENRDGAPLEVEVVNPNKDHCMAIRATLAGETHTLNDFDSFAAYVEAAARRHESIR
jgi:hypothetical protein